MEYRKSDKQTRPEISLVVPMYNEEEGMDLFFTRLFAVLVPLGVSFEVVCVNDGSSDSTLEKLHQHHSLDARIRVVSLSRNFGKDIAMTAGLDYCRGKWVIPIDADLQDPPELIPSLYEKALEGFDVVYAVRRSRAGESSVKRASAFWFYRLFVKVTGLNMPRDTGDFRIMHRRVLRALKTVREKHRFMKGLFSWVGYRQTGVFYDRENRAAGSTKWNYWKLWNFAIDGFTSFSIAPLKVASYVGVLVSFLSFGAAVFYAFKTIWLGGDRAPGFPTLIVTITLLGGLQLITLGIIGEYLGRTYNETKKRPLYLVSKTLGIQKLKKRRGVS